MGSLTITTVIVIACLAAAHGLMWVVGPSKRFWTKIDYLWLGAAALGLITATGAVRATLAGNDEPSARIRFGAELDHAKWWARTSLSYFETSVFLTTAPANDRDAATATAVREAADFYRTVVADLDRESATQPWLRISSSSFVMNRATDPMVEQDLVHLRRTLATLQEAYEALDATRNAMQPTTLETVYIMLWPWLLSVALALRVAKVSAELLGYTVDPAASNSALHPTPVDKDVSRRG